jgi:hypothetical protein
VSAITIFGIDYIKSTYREEIETYPHIASCRLSNGDFRKLPRHLVLSQLGSFAITIDSNAHRFVRTFENLNFQCDIYFMEMIFFLRDNIGTLNRKSYEWILIDSIMKGLPGAGLFVSHLDELRNHKTLPKDVNPFNMYVEPKTNNENRKTCGYLCKCRCRPKCLGRCGCNSCMTDTVPWHMKNIK